ncbi:MAG: hypothetical protein V3V70_03700 [Candidatus Scalindua sp.]
MDRYKGKSIGGEIQKKWLNMEEGISKKAGIMAYVQEKKVLLIP